MRSRPTTGISIASAARCATSSSVGCTRSVTSTMVPPVCTFAVRRTTTVTPASSTDSKSRDSAPSTARVTSSRGMSAAPSASAPRASLRSTTSSRDRANAVTRDLGGRRTDAAHHLAVDHDHAEILALAAPLEHDRGTDRPRRVERVAQRRCIGDAHRDAPALLTLGRLDHDVTPGGEERVVRRVEGGGTAAAERGAPRQRAPHG